MVSKSMAREKLKSIINSENRQKVEELINRIDIVSDEQWESFITGNNITEDNLIDVIKERTSTNGFKNINDLISYGISGRTLHIHIIPNDVKTMLNREGLTLANLKLIQALEQIKSISQRNETIKTIFAVSPILRLRQLQKMFADLGFAVSETTSEDLLQKFPDAKSVYQASLSKEILLSKEWEDKVNDVRESINGKTKRLEYKYTNSNGKNFVGYPIQGNQNHTLSYMLVIPEELQDGKELVVESLNYEGTNIFENIVQHEQNNVRRMLEIVEDAPIMIPFLPDVKGGRPYYQQLSRECFEESVDDEYSVDFPRVDLKVIDAINDARKRIQEITSKRIADKIFLNGYSSSGVFAQRFALLHPEVVGRALIGGASGTIPLPTEDFGYPLGIKDFEELFGVQFDETEYKKIQFAYYVGELEAKTPAWGRDINGNKVKRDSEGNLIDKTQIIPPMHDMSYYPRSTPLNMGEQQRNILGRNLQDRWEKCLEYYEYERYHITHKVYRGAEHRGIYDINMNPVAGSVIRDIKKFYKENQDFPQDIAGVEEISMRFQREREENLDEVAREH